MRRNEKIRQIMTTTPTTIQVGQPLSEANAVMRTGGFHHVPVLDGRVLVGILSSTDLLEVSYTHGADARETDTVLDHTVTVRALMQSEPVTLGDEQTVRDAVEILSSGDFHALPVIDGDRHLVGLVTTTDVLRYVLDQY